MTLRVAALVLVLVAAHLTLRVAFGLGNEAPDLLVLAVLLASRHMTLRGGGLLGFVIGLIEDGLSVSSFGTTVFALTVLGVAGAQSRILFVGRSKSFLVGYLAVGKWLRDLLAWLVSDPAARGAFGDYLLFESPLMALYASVVGTAIALVAFKGSGRA